MNFALMQHHKYSLTEIENMIPWEREIYTSLLADHVQKENEQVPKSRKSAKVIIRSFNFFISFSAQIKSLPGQEMLPTIPALSAAIARAASLT